MGDEADDEASDEAGEADDEASDDADDEAGDADDEADDEADEDTSELTEFMGMLHLCDSAAATTARATSASFTPWFIARLRSVA